MLRISIDQLNLLVGDRKAAVGLRCRRQRARRSGVDAVVRQQLGALAIDGFPIGRLRLFALLGPRAVVTSHPVGGRAQGGGQRRDSRQRKVPHLQRQRDLYGASLRGRLR